MLNIHRLSSVTSPATGIAAESAGATAVPGIVQAASAKPADDKDASCKNLRRDTIDKFDMSHLISTFFEQDTSAETHGDYWARAGVS